MADIESALIFETAASNTAPSPDGLPASSSPNIVYSEGREVLAMAKRWWNRANPTVTSGGSGTVGTLTYGVAPLLYVRGQTYAFIVGVTNTGAYTLNVNGLGAKSVTLGGAALVGGELVVGAVVELCYDGTNLVIIGASAGKASVAGYLPLTGGTLTGVLNINNAPGYALTINAAPASGAFMQLNKPSSATSAGITGSMATLSRWQILLGDGVAESGGNVGSNFQLIRFDDSGNSIDTPLSIPRSTGQLTLAGFLNAPGYKNRSGIAGSYSASNFNLFYNAGPTQLWIDNTNTGNITVTSDYRTKRDIAPLPSMWERIRKLRPISYKHKDWTPAWEEKKDQPFFRGDDVERWGFVAHELQEDLIPDAANGSKDEEHVIQSPNPLTILAAVTRTLQEACARIEALEAKVVRLEAGLAAASTA